MTLFNNPVIGQLCKFSLRNYIDPGPIRQRVSCERMTGANAPTLDKPTIPRPLARLRSCLRGAGHNRDFPAAFADNHIFDYCRFCLCTLLGTAS